ncbi:hypothetical protein CLAFUW4_13598 [Fulvia fulva]|uniref:Uncharacterized protein n=1 Tax=Passalora fulva TaxID=5499 RepID=A0A9Q8PLG5_PASFU|nr:uncharacterized protein CLAFUR5_13450 [Fulvia fulva]KAK4610587.1 hypothetical protein CLAFUR4_13601 [Fulvia fulva]KAK4611202.1 hypothetical protein CLAFUR0_13606 [Fulvia fulva]UJO24648.1 hypothetical protein CLAFUR5_13450 [Fulvia fulva]WPV21752.1 hypothetical protein CLAFUW4_13598 [Fulvia fulva]WPV37053.1 hypothetical protein CLAFUW7_13606 [Fulvia fulva]
MSTLCQPNNIATLHYLVSHPHINRNSTTPATTKAPPSTNNITGTMTSEQTATSTKCHLLAIPPELRLMIYEYYFSALAQWSPKDAQRFMNTKPKSFQPALLKTCTTSRSEGVSIYKKHLEALRQSGWNGSAQSYGTRDLQRVTDLDSFHRQLAYVVLRDQAYGMELEKCEQFLDPTWTESIIDWLAGV